VGAAAGRHVPVLDLDEADLVVAGSEPLLGRLVERDVVPQERVLARCRLPGDVVGVPDDAIDAAFEIDQRRVVDLVVGPEVDPNRLVAAEVAVGRADVEPAVADRVEQPTGRPEEGVAGCVGPHAVHPTLPVDGTQHRLAGAHGVRFGEFVDYVAVFEADVLHAVRPDTAGVGGLAAALGEEVRRLQSHVAAVDRPDRRRKLRRVRFGRGALSAHHPPSRMPTLKSDRAAEGSTS